MKIIFRTTTSGTNSEQKPHRYNCKQFLILPHKFISEFDLRPLKLAAPLGTEIRDIVRPLSIVGCAGGSENDHNGTSCRILQSHSRSPHNQTQYKEEINPEPEPQVPKQKKVPLFLQKRKSPNEPTV